MFVVVLNLYFTDVGIEKNINNNLNLQKYL